MARSSTLEKEARRRLSFVTPENAAKVLSKDIYWTVPFLTLFLERCELLGVEEPDRALRMAINGPPLALRIDVGKRRGEYSNAKSKNSHLVMALSMLGGLNRRNGNMSEARGVFAHAVELIDGEPVTRHARADFLWRFGRLQSATDAAGAIDSFNESASIFMKMEHRNGMAMALLARGTFYGRLNEWASSADDLQRACQAADENTAIGKVALHAALINLCFAVANGGINLDAQSNILKFIATLRSRLGQKRFSRTKAKLYWMEGLLHQNLGFTRQAERVLERARQGFTKLGDPYDFVLVTLDLAQVLLLDGESEKYEQLQRDTIAALEKITPPEDLRDALTEWRRLPHTENVLTKIKGRVRNLV